MGNLVTTSLTLSGPEAALERIIGLLTTAAPDQLLANARSAPNQPLWADFAPWRAVPEPEVISVTRDGQITDIGLAALSRGGTDHLRLKQGRDPFLSDMPPEYGETADSLLAKLGLEKMTGEDLLKAVELKVPGCLDAGRRAIAAYEQTGEFGWYDWRKRHWGARAFGAELRVSALPDGSLTLRFESVNDCPVPLIRALMADSPEVQLSGAAIDEDADIAVFLVSDGPDLIVSESDTEEEMGRAYEIVYGRARDHEPDEGDDPEP